MKNPRQIDVGLIIQNGYHISEDGNIISYKGRKPRILKAGAATDGYMMVNLRINGKSIAFLVHRLVAECYIPPIEGKRLVNHIDGNKRNNARNNLEWCDHKENMVHAQSLGIGGFLNLPPYT